MTTDTRTDGELNRIIAEWMGVWSPVCDRIGGCMKILFGPKVACKCDDMEPTCPDYCRDLNAVHEAVAKCSELLLIGYVNALHKICRPNPGVSSIHVIEASARHRAEALVKSIDAT